MNLLDENIPKSQRDLLRDKRVPIRHIGHDIEGYCLVHLDVVETEAAAYIVRLLRHSELKTRAMRLGCVIHVSAAEVTLWRAGQKEQFHLPWQ